MRECSGWAGRVLGHNFRRHMTEESPCSSEELTRVLDLIDKATNTYGTWDDVRCVMDRLRTCRYHVICRRCGLKPGEENNAGHQEQ